MQGLPDRHRAGPVATRQPIRARIRGSGAAGRRIEYSIAGGDSWTTLTTSAGPSPYNWDLTTVPNSTRCLVRVKITDNGAPALSQSDASNANFTIQ